MTRFIARRVGLGLITLVLLSIIVFFAAQVLPGDVGRSVLGPLADQKSVDALNHQLGTDRSLVVQYADWVGGFRDRVISLGGLSATAIPDFVWAVVLILVFALTLGILPATATPPPESG